MMCYHSELSASSGDASDFTLSPPNLCSSEVMYLKACLETSV